MLKATAYIRIVFFLMPAVLLLAAFVPAAPGNDNSVITTPYTFGMPGNLLPVLNPCYNQATVQGVELGRKLFYDPILSGNQKQACAGCHKQEFSFTDGKDISVGSLGKIAHRNSMTLVNLGWQDKYFWDGRALTLEELIHFPVTDSLEMNADTAQIVKRLNSDKAYKALFGNAFGTGVVSMQLVSKALAQFLRTVVSYNAPMDIIGRDYMANGGELQSPDYLVTDEVLLINMLGPGNAEKYNHDAATVQKIKQVSASKKVVEVFSVCMKCHYNTLQVFCNHCDGNIPFNAQIQFKNNGLGVYGRDTGLYQLTRKEEDKYVFKVPTFRNLVFSAPYMHDGRFKTLEEVVDHYNTGIQPNPNLDTLLMDNNKQPIRFNLNADEKRQLLGLLKLFTDSTVVTDKRFSEPVTR